MSTNFVFRMQACCPLRIPYMYVVTVGVGGGGGGVTIMVRACTRLSYYIKSSSSRQLLFVGYVSGQSYIAAAKSYDAKFIDPFFFLSFFAPVCILWMPATKNMRVGRSVVRERDRL